MRDFKLIAIDAGTTHSAFAVYRPLRPQICDFGIEDNESILLRLKALKAENLGRSRVYETRLVCEMIKSYGNPLGDSVLLTVLWIGRFVQEWADRPYELIARKTIVSQLTGLSTSGDSRVRQALINYHANKGLYGPQNQYFKDPSAVEKITRKGNPLYGVRKDVWSALAVATVWRDLSEKNCREIL